MVKRGQKLRLPFPGRFPAGMQHYKHHLLSPANKPLQGAAGLPGGGGGKFCPFITTSMDLDSAYAHKCKLLLTLQHVTSLELESA